MDSARGRWESRLLLLASFGCGVLLGAIAIFSLVEFRHDLESMFAALQTPSDGFGLDEQTAKNGKFRYILRGKQGSNEAGVALFVSAVDGDGGSWHRLAYSGSGALRAGWDQDVLAVQMDRNLVEAEIDFALYAKLGFECRFEIRNRVR